MEIWGIIKVRASDLELSDDELKLCFFFLFNVCPRGPAAIRMNDCCTRPCSRDKNMRKGWADKNLPTNLCGNHCQFLSASNDLSQSYHITNVNFHLFSHFFCPTLLCYTFIHFFPSLLFVLIFCSSFLFCILFGCKF